MLKQQLKLVLFLFALTSLVTSPFADCARSAAPPVPLRVNQGIHAALASNCAVYASASGNDQNDGLTRRTPKTLYGTDPTNPSLTSAAGVVQPGQSVCLLGGRYELNNTFCPQNNSTSWITYEAYGDGPVNFVWSGFVNGSIPSHGFAQSMIRMGSGGNCWGSSSPSKYLEFHGLNLNGSLENAADGFFCYGTDHVHFIGNTIMNTSGSGIGAVGCDYLVSDNNVVYHNGYLPAVCTNGPSTTVQNYCNGMSWTSGISYNNITWADTYDGLHNVISNNIIAGEADQRNKWVPPQPPTDGGGIIFDIANNGANTPAGLIINNVVYSNGGYCIAVNAKITNFWIVNNTCKKNNLDLNEPSYGSFVANASSNGFYFNNISYVWESAAANAYPYAQENTNTNIGYFFNQYDGRSDGACCKTFSSQSYQNFFGEDPKFANHPYVDATAEGQYATARPPAQSPPDLGLTLSSNSPAYNQGVDPTTYCNSPYYCASTAMSADVRRDIRGYLYTDFRGNPRPSGGPFDLGAYQH